jgi:hypothetical protein
MYEFELFTFQIFLSEHYGEIFSTDKHDNASWRMNEKTHGLVFGASERDQENYQARQSPTERSGTDSQFNRCSISKLRRKPAISEA